MKKLLIIILGIQTAYYGAAQKVGIGTNTPAFKLDVKDGSINTDSLYRIGGNAVLSVKGNNTFTGINSGFSNTTGSLNTANGTVSLYSNTTGAFNTANGFAALYSNTNGQENIAVGYNALFSNTTGNKNTANGVSALYFNTIGNYNTAHGYGALFSNTTGNSNTAHGYAALTSNTSGEANTANGFVSLKSNTTGLNNTALGHSSLFSNTTGNYNTANGYRALYSNAVGINNSSTGSFSLVLNTTGSDNTANGYSALGVNNIGGQNTAVGGYALTTTISSVGNTAVGFRAGDTYNNGYYNTFLGSDADANGPDYYNSIAIGNQSRVTAPLQVRIGGTFIESIGGYQGWTNFSDGRYKKNIKEDIMGIDFIMKLRPVTYNLDVTGISQKLNESRGDETDKLMAKSISAKEKTVFSGFIAQEVEAAAKATGYDFSGVDKPKNANDFYGLRYAEFVVPLVKAMQEQQGLILNMQKRIETQQQQIDQLLLLLKK